MHEFSYEYTDKVFDPETALADRPTEQEFDLFQQWDALVWPASEELDSLEEVVQLEDTAYKKVAEKYGVSAQRVKDAVWKCTLIWPYR